MVSVMVEWRARVWAILGCTPLLARSVTNECRREWKSALRPAWSVYRRKSLASRSLVPSAWLLKAEAQTPVPVTVFVFSRATSVVTQATDRTTDSVERPSFLQPPLVLFQIP